MRKNPLVKHAIDRWWLGMAKNHKNEIEKETYVEMLVVIYMLMIPAEDEHNDTAHQNAELDWVRDSKDRSSMSYELFYDAMLELADVWTEIKEPHEYESFLTILHKKVADEALIQSKYFIKNFQFDNDEEMRKISDEMEHVNNIIASGPHASDPTTPHSESTLKSLDLLEDVDDKQDATDRKKKKKKKKKKQIITKKPETLTNLVSLRNIDLHDVHYPYGTSNMSGTRRHTTTNLIADRPGEFFRENINKFEYKKRIEEAMKKPRYTDAMQRAKPAPATTLEKVILTQRKTQEHASFGTVPKSYMHLCSFVDMGIVKVSELRAGIAGNTYAISPIVGSTRSKSMSRGTGAAYNL